MEPPNLKNQNKNYKTQQNSVNHYNESTSSPSLDKILELDYNKNNKKRRKRKRNINKKKLKKYVQ